MKRFILAYSIRFDLILYNPPSIALRDKTTRCTAPLPFRCAIFIPSLTVRICTVIEHFAYM